MWLLLTCFFLVSWQDAAVNLADKSGPTHTFTLRKGGSPALLSTAFLADAAPAESVVPTLSGNNTTAVKSIVDPFELFALTPLNACCPCAPKHCFKPPFPGGTLLYSPHYFSFSLFLVIRRLPSAVLRLFVISQSLYADNTNSFSLTGEGLSVNN